MSFAIKTRKKYETIKRASSLKYTYSDPTGVFEENGQIKLTKSGILTFERDSLIDVFIVGGGGAGKHGGGGGGYTKTARQIQVTAGIEYEIVIGDGGIAATTSNTFGTVGGTSTAIGFSASGGGIAGHTTATTGTTRFNGGSGGSGGGGGTSSGAGGNGGTNGADGKSVSDNGAGRYGQGYTTRAFEEEFGTAYAAGGGGCPGSASATPGVGGEMGAGDGAYSTAGNVSGAPNTGSGGGGTYASTGRISNGGSGIVIVRSAKKVERQYLYSANDHHTGFTNGWIGEAKLPTSDSGTTKRANVVTQDGNLILNNSGNYSGVIRPALGVDLTPYKTLVFEGKFTRGGSVARNLTAAVWSKIGTYYATESEMIKKYQMPSTGTVNRIEIDVSDIDGLGYPGIGVATSNVMISACYLEPKDDNPETWQYLYSAGNEYESITGGWVGNNKKSYSSSGATAREPAIDRSNTGYIVADTSPSYGGMFITKNKIDLTPYKEIVFEGEFLADSSAAQNLYAGAWSTIGSYYQENPVAHSGSNMESTLKKIVVPVTNVNALCYIGLGLTRMKATIRACYLIPKSF